MKQTYTLPPTHPFENHGRTTASWALVGLTVLGALTIGIGMVLRVLPVQIVGAAIIAIGVAVSVGLKAAGKGQPRTKPRPGWYED